MTDHKKPDWKFWATVALVVVLVGYVGAYALMVGPGLWSINFSGGRDMTGSITGEIPPYYSAGIHLPLNQQLFERLFAPIHWIDRRVRRDAWNWRYPD